MKLLLVLTMAAAAGAQPALVANVEAHGLNTTTSASINTTGATLIVIHTAGLLAATVSDSKANTWIGITALAGPSAEGSRIWYCVSCVVGTGHTFTFTGTTVYTAMQVAAFSGTATANTFDSMAEWRLPEFGQNPSTGCSPGLLATRYANELLVTGIQFGGTGSITGVSDSYSITNQTAGSAANWFGGGLAWKISPGSSRPVWTMTSAGTAEICTMASFRPAGAAPLTSVRQSTTCVGPNVGSSSVTTCPLPYPVVSGNLYVVVTGHPGGDECNAGPMASTRGGSWTARADAENTGGSQSNSCIMTAPITSSGTDSIVRTAGSGNYPLAMMVIEVGGSGFAFPGANQSIQDNGFNAGLAISTGNVTSAASNNLLVCGASDNFINQWDTYTPSGSTTFGVLPTGGFLYKLVPAGTYACTFAKTNFIAPAGGGGGNRYSSTAVIISFTPAGRVRHTIRQ